MWYLTMALVGVTAAAFSTLAGFGGGIIFIGFASLFLDIKTVVPLSAGFFMALSAAQMVVFRRHIDWRSVGLYCGGALPGILLGMWFFYLLPGEAMKRILAGLVLLYVLMLVLRSIPEKCPNSPVTASISAIAGIVDAVTASGGIIQAPLFLARGLRKEAFVASFGATSVLLNPLKLFLYHRMGFLEPANIALLGVLVIAGFLGVLLGRLGLRKITSESFRRLAIGFLVVVAIRMLFF